MRYLECRSAALGALRAADSGDIDGALSGAEKVESLAAGNRHARWVVVAGHASAMAIQSSAEYSGQQLLRALRLLESGIAALPSVDRDFRAAMHPRLLASHIALSALAGDQARISEDLPLLRTAWANLYRDPAMSQALVLVPQGRTVLLGALTEAGWATLTQLRVADAREVLELSLELASEARDAKITYISSVLLSFAAMVSGAHDQAIASSARALEARQRQREFRTSIPAQSMALLDVMLAQVLAHDAERGSRSRDALEVLRNTRKRLGSVVSDETIPAYLQIVGLEMQHLLDSGDDSAARATADSVGLFELYRGTAGGILSGPLVRLMEHEAPPSRAAGIVARLDREYAWQIPPSLLVEHLGAMSMVCVRAGDDDLAISCGWRAVEAMSLLASGAWTANARRSALEVHQIVRDGCLRALSHVSDVEASECAFSLMEAWREGTLRELVSSSNAGLSPDARKLVKELDAVLRSLTTASDQSTAAGFAKKRIPELRAALADLVGEGYARMVAPRPIARRGLTWSESKVHISACLIELDGTQEIVAGIAFPGKAPVLRRSRLPANAADFLDLLRGGFDPVSKSAVSDFDDEWRAARRGLAYALGIDLVEDLDESIQTRFTLDGPLRQLPLAALGTGIAPLGERVSVEHAPLGVGAGNSPEDVSFTVGQPSVLAYVLSDATEEIAVLVELATSGEIRLDIATSPRSIRAKLQTGEFDLLVISAHGEGKGLGYLFRDHEAPGEDLHVHDLLGLRIPPVVLVASCYSGLEGETDITGLLATLHAHGAREVLSALWAVPSTETSEIVRHVLCSLNSPGSLAKKLQEAQQSFRSSHPDRPEMYWWAGLSVSQIPESVRSA